MALLQLLVFPISAFYFQLFPRRSSLAPRLPPQVSALRSSGLVTRGRQHVLVDDVTTMGGTLADLNNYIMMHGGSVAAVLVLVNAGRSKQLRPTKPLVRKIQSRYGPEIHEIFGIAPDALTANEANYLIGFRTPDEIRNRLAKAREETHRRLHSKRT